MAEGIINISEFPQVNDILPVPDVAIPAGADLDDYWVPGVYVIASIAIRNQVANVPSDSTYGGKLMAMTTSTNSDGQFAVQFFVNTRGESWRRYKLTSSDAPSAWVKDTTQGAITPSSLHVVSYDAQTLDAAKRGQALSNLGLSSSNVLYTAQSLTSTAKNQVLTNLGIKTLVDSLNTTSAISASTFFSTKPASSGATYSIYKNGKVVSLYADFTVRPSDGTVANAYRPYNSYIIMPVFSHTSPYAPVGSVWLYNNGSLKFYGVPSSGCYVSGTWVTK